MTAQEHIDAQAPEQRMEELETELAATEVAIAEYRQQCLDTAAEIARLRSESEERLQNCAALVAENERLRAAPATAPEQMPLERDCICHQYLHLDAYSGGAAPEGLHGALWVVVEGVRKKYVLADQSSEPKDMPALATTPKQPRPFVPWSKEAEMLESWAAQPAPQPERKPMHEGEIQAAWLGQDLDEPIPYTFVLGIRSAERFNGIKETP